MSTDRYFYGAESELFAFFRIPKSLFSNELYRPVSVEAKLLYGLMLDRMELSAKNSWLDECGRVYIIFTVEEIMNTLGCGNKKACQLLTELENKAKLIERRRRGLGKPSLIYVLNFTRTEVSEDHFKTCRKDSSRSVEMTFQEVSNQHTNNTDSINTDHSNTDPSILSGRGVDRFDKNSSREFYEEFFRESLSSDSLIQDNPGNRDTILGILELLTDTCCTNRKTVRIAGDDKPADVVRNRLMKLDSGHINYVVQCMAANTTPVRNIRAYLLTALYNAPATIEPYYQAAVNHDFYGTESGR